MFRSQVFEGDNNRRQQTSQLIDWIGPVGQLSENYRRGFAAIFGLHAAAANGHRPLPHPRTTLGEGEAGDLIPSFPFAEAGYGEEDTRGTRIVLTWGIEQGMKEGKSFVPCSVIMDWLGHDQGVTIPRSNSIKYQIIINMKTNPYVYTRVFIYV